MYKVFLLIGIIWLFFTTIFVNLPTTKLKGSKDYFEFFNYNPFFAIGFLLIIIMGYLFKKLKRKDYQYKGV
jgi:hypothetical protein